MSRFLQIAESAARAGGAVLNDWFDRKTSKQKGPKDLVTEADLASQAVIRNILLSEYPDHGFLGEEGDYADSQCEYRWIVDPLDGTANYVHRLPGFAVSIALQRGPEMVVGVVFDPYADECFVAERGNGARRNGTSIRTSDCQLLENALVAASFSPSVRRGSIEIDRFVAVLEAAQSVRRLGSAALNLCYVAMGRLDAYWTTSVQAWDVAAGVLIVDEAGGFTRNLSGEPLDWQKPELISASQITLYQQLASTLREA